VLLNPSLESRSGSSRGAAACSPPPSCPEAAAAACPVLKTSCGCATADVIKRQLPQPVSLNSSDSPIQVCLPQGVAVVFDYVQWLTGERGVNVRTEGIVLRSIMAAAKFLYHAESTVGRIC